MPKTIFMEAPWDGEIVLGKEFIDELKNRAVKKVALFASVQFLHLDGVIEKISSMGIEVLTTRAKRTNAQIQVLGCDAYHDSYKEDIIGESDAIVYIGDGLFHPKAIVLSQRESKNKKDVIIWDPVSVKMRILTAKTVEAQVKKTIANLKRFIAARTVGVIVTLKPGQQYMDIAKKLKEHLKSQGKECYIFVDDFIKLEQFENYPFIEAWVNTACPRIGLDDHVHASKPLINSREAFDPVAALEKLVE